MVLNSDYSLCDMSVTPGQIRVGRRVYDRQGKFADPSFPGFTPIRALTASTEYGSLGPYVLKNNRGQIMENVYQAHKIYTKVPKTVQRYSRYDPTVVWNYPEETHILSEDDQKLVVAPKYWQWREKLMNNPYPVRYPVGFHARHQCRGSIAISGTRRKLMKVLDYTSARLQVYLPLYLEMVRDQPQFHELRHRLDKGENLLIIEVDGPHEESLEWYQKTYGVDDSFIERQTMLCTRENLEIMINDTKHPFGHGYCLAIGLMMDPQTLTSLDSGLES